MYIKELYSTIVNTASFRGACVRNKNDSNLADDAQPSLVTDMNKPQEASCGLFIGHITIHLCKLFQVRQGPMLSIASLTRLTLTGSGLRIITSRLSGIICHVTPNLSLSQSQDITSPPSMSTFHSLSISIWSLQFTAIEIASLNVYIGPPLRVVKF